MNGFKVKIFTPENASTVSVEKAFLTVGRSDRCDIQVDDKAVNEEHLRIWCEGGRLWAQDLGTSCGTSMNELPLPRLRPLLFRETDIFRLGNSSVTLTFEPNWIRPANINKSMEQIGVPIHPAVPADTLKQLDEELEERRKEKRQLAKELAQLKLHRQFEGLRAGAADAIPAEEWGRLRLKAIKEVNAYKEAEFRKFELQKERMMAELKAEQAHAALRPAFLLAARTALSMTFMFVAGGVALWYLNSRPSMAVNRQIASTPSTVAPSSEDAPPPAKLPQTQKAPKP